MQCREFEKLMHAVLDERGRPAVDPRLAAHAADCRRCREMLHAQAAMLVALQDLSAPAARRDFSRRAVAAALARPVPNFASSQRRVTAYASLAAAATILLSVAILWQVRQHRGTWSSLREQAGPVIGGRAGRGTISVARSARKNQDAKSSAVELTGGQWLIEAPRLPQHLRHYRGAIGEFALSLPQAVEQLEYVDQMSPSFRTLRVSLGEIWDTLCRTIPGSRSAPEEPLPARRASQRPSSTFLA